MQIARNVSENCFVRNDAISRIKGGEEVLKNLVNLFLNSSSSHTRETENQLYKQLEDISFENIQSAKHKWVKKRSFSNLSNDEVIEEGSSKLAHKKLNGKTDASTRPDTVIGFVGEVEVKFKIDQALKSSLLAEEVWYKAGIVI